jgi:hypothetical protein
MSKFTDKLERIYKSAAPAMGFRRPADEAELPPLLLVADLTRAGVKKAKSIVDSGIDAAIVSSESVDAISFKELATGIPLGLLLDKNIDQAKIQELINSGCDFVVFGLETPLEAVNKEGLGRILKIEPSLAPVLIRAINELSFSIDAVLVAEDNSSITIERLLTCQLFVSLVNKPLLINVNASLTSGELSSLHGTGAKGIILPEGAPIKVFDELKKAISSLPKTPRRKTKSSVLLPHIGPQPETKAEEVEEEEEEEDI